MRVHVWGINYAPEPTGIGPHNTALCEHLARRGHDVKMFTSFAYYPAWKKSDADRGRLWRTDSINGVAVHRCWHFVPRRPSALKRIFHEATFVLTSLVRVLAAPRPDVMVVVSPPLLLGFAAWFVGAIKRAPFVFHVQDLQPDAAVGLGMIRAGWFVRLLYGLEAFAYRKAARVSGISAGMPDVFAGKNVAREKLVLFPNGVRIPPPEEMRRTNRFRARHGFSGDDFLAVYSGNFGVKQGLRILVDAARRVRDPRVRVVLCGEGGGRPDLESAVADAGLKNVTILPLQTDSDYREMLADADVCLIPQQAGSGGAFFPSKLLPALAFGKPVVTVADAGSQLVRELDAGGFGRNVPPGDSVALARELDALAQQPGQLAQFSVAARRHAEQWECGAVLADFERVLVSLA